MSEVRELEDKILLMRNAIDSRTGKPMVEVSPRYARELFAERTRLAVMKEDSRYKAPRINAQQLATMNRADLDLIARASAVKNPATGRRLVEEQPALREKLFTARTQVMSGTPLSEGTKAATLKTLEGTK